jgi:predicted esterase
MNSAAFKYRFLMAMLLLAGLAGAQDTAPVIDAIGEEAYGVLAATYDYDDKIPLEARVVELKDEETTVRRKIVFRGARGFMVPGYLEIPKKGAAPYPCVLLAHGWSGSKESWWKDGGYLSGGNARTGLLEAGYAVFALDAPTHGDRIAENDYSLVNDFNEEGAVPRKNYFTVREIIAQAVVDYRRGIDYLESRDDIDLSRLGLLGYSMGGFHGIALGAVEPRIQVMASCVVPVSWREDPILNPANYAQGIGDRPYLMMQGRTDSMCDEAHAKALYKHVESPKTKLLLYDAGHKLPVDWVADAMAWFVKWL